jgi:serine/threonine-protein kinase
VSGGSVRSTVLPRVEWEGPHPKVQPSERHRFEELGLLGEGGMGEVVLAQDHDIERQVALKRLPKNCDLGRVMRFVEEIRTVGQLEHPNIVPVHDVGIDASGRYYFVMKKLNGETLESIIDRLRAGEAAAHARFTIPVRLQIMLGVMNALSYAHKQGYMHRDLKPANIMVGPHGEVTVMDWGLAKRVRTADAPGTSEISFSRARTVLQTQLGAIMGTPLYMSPEQARGANDTLDERTDLYSLSVVFHELLYLKHYLKDVKQDVHAVLDAVKNMKPPLHGPAVNGKRIPAELDWYLERGLEKDISKRYQSIGEMTEELQRIIRGECRVQCRRTFMKRMIGKAGKFNDQHPILLMVGTVSVLALFGAAIVKSLLVLSS